jgi:hypothetical protein
MCGRFVQKSPAAEIEFSFLTRNPLPNALVAQQMVGSVSPKPIL